MTSATNPLSYLAPSAYQSAVLPSASSGAGGEQSTGVSALAELQSMQRQGELQNFLKNSVGAALLQPVNAVNNGTTMTTLLNNMLQQVLGAYHAQTAPPETNSS